jgi:hypothetical protein
MAVLSVDLAHKRWADIGVCSLEARRDAIVVSPISLPARGLFGPPTATAVAEVLADLAERVDARLILLDGPQAWKGPQNGLDHCRLCERHLATQGKTGLPGITKPANYGGFIAFAIEVFDRLDPLGWPRLPSRSALVPTERFALESFPTSAWRFLRLKSLPGKANRRGPSVREKLAELERLFPLSIAGGSPLTHDELQAAVAGLAGVAVEGHAAYDFVLDGEPPFRLDDSWREGFIVNPVPRGAGPPVRRSAAPARGRTSASWSGLVQSAPDLGAAGRRLLVGSDGVAFGLFASVGRDARPHLSPVCPVFCGEHVYLVAAGHTPKVADLRRNPAFVLHALPAASDEEFQIAGRAEEVLDATEREAVHAAIPFAAFGRTDPIFRLAIERALWVRWERVGQPDTEAVRTRWKAGGDTTSAS